MTSFILDFGFDIVTGLDLMGDCLARQGPHKGLCLPQGCCRQTPLPSHCRERAGFLLLLVPSASLPPESRAGTLSAAVPLFVGWVLWS